jgi:hypothetical protein
MKKRVFNILAGVSFVVCLATTAIWLRSYYVIDEVNIVRSNLYKGISGAGGIWVLPLELMRRWEVEDQNGHWRLVSEKEDYSKWLERSPHRAKVEKDQLSKISPEVAASWQGGWFMPKAWEYRPYDPISMDDKVLGLQPFSTSITILSGGRETISFIPMKFFDLYLIGPRIRIPYWPIILITAIIPLFWYRAYRRLVHRRKNGLCLNCGYDLRATLDRCPECGMVVEKPAWAVDIKYPLSSHFIIFPNPLSALLPKYLGRSLR